jgi:hypothetical protein
MAEAVTEQARAPRSGREWFWRFLAVLMLASVAWVVWVAAQISPMPLATEAAFEAAAQARASRNSQGVIKAAAQPAPDKPAAAAKEPPVNVEKLRLADSIQTPISGE